MDVQRRWNEHLRRESNKQKSEKLCPLCSQLVQTPERPQNGSTSEAAFASFQRHLSDVHAPLLAEKANKGEETTWIRELWEVAQLSDQRDGVTPSSSSLEYGQDGQPNSTRPSNQRFKPIRPVSLAATPKEHRTFPSPATTIKREGSRSRSVSPPKRSKARTAASPDGEDARAEFDRGTYQKGRLWSPDDCTAAPRPRLYDKSNVATSQRRNPSSGPTTRPSRPAPQPADNVLPHIIDQPETRRISQEQLVAEVKGIYAGLVMVESKCIEVDNAQSEQNKGTSNQLNTEQWQALIALHRTLLHEHHDFFLASQHPSASPALRRLAAKYAMPARMWRHGIHSFLELLRHRLPASLDHMLTFIYTAYSMMALLYETVPALEDTWIECLGDLGRYRMAIEDDDIRDREVWTAVSRHWYSRACDKAPTTGRLYHHLAILARPNALQQLFMYSKSLSVDVPFGIAHEANLTLFDPILGDTPPACRVVMPKRFFTKGRPFCDNGDGTWFPTGPEREPGENRLIIRISDPRAWEPDMAMHTAYQAKTNTTRGPSHHPSSRLPRGLLKLIRAFLPPLLLALLPLAASQPLIPDRASQILFVFISGLTSLGTGMASLQLPPDQNPNPNPNPGPGPDPDRGTQLTRMYLRLISLFFLGVAGVAYKLFFLPARDSQKTTAFLQAFCVLTGFCWVVVHPRWNAGSEDGKKGGGDDGLSWLDGVGLYGLIAVSGGMLFAEWTSSRRGGEGADGRRRGPGDEESQGADGGRGDATTTAIDSGAGGGDGEGADGRRREADVEESQGADGRRGGAAPNTARDGGNAAEGTSNLGQVVMPSLMNCLLGA